MVYSTFGLVLASSTVASVSDPDPLWASVEEADRSTLEYLWISDHIVWWHPMYEALTFLAAVAARTKRIKVGTAVMLLALRDPLLAAKSLATIQQLSGGRLTLGVGIGGEFPLEWEAIGVSLRTRASRTEEMVEALRGLWGPSPFGYSGRRIDFAQVDLQPKPETPIPIWFGGRSDAAVKRAARMGDGWMGLFLTPERYAKQVALLKSEAEASGRDPDGLVHSHYIWTCIADTNDEAKTIASNLLGAFYNLPFSKLERYAVIGTPERCAERFDEFAQAGVQHFVVAPVGQPRGFTSRLTEQVLPLVRA